VNRVTFLLVVVAVVVLLFASAATAQDYTGSGGSTASPSASATASPTATLTATPTATPTATATATADAAAMASRRFNPLRIKTGGPPLAAPFAALALIGSGVAALAFVRRYTSS
jgi:hypothetical protein